MNQHKNLEARMNKMVADAGVIDMSPAEVKSYLGALEDKLLESGNPLSVKQVHVMRRARERAARERGDLGEIFSEEWQKYEEQH